MHKMNTRYIMRKGPVAKEKQGANDNSLPSFDFYYHTMYRLGILCSILLSYVWEHRLGGKDLTGQSDSSASRVPYFSCFVEHKNVLVVIMEDQTAI